MNDDKHSVRHHQLPGTRRARNCGSSEMRKLVTMGTSETNPILWLRDLKWFAGTGCPKPLITGFFWKEIPTDLSMQRFFFFLLPSPHATQGFLTQHGWGSSRQPTTCLAIWNTPGNPWYNPQEPRTQHTPDHFSHTIDNSQRALRLRISSQSTPAVVASRISCSIVPSMEGGFLWIPCTDWSRVWDLLDEEYYW